MNRCHPLVLGVLVLALAARAQSPVPPAPPKAGQTESKQDPVEKPASDKPNSEEQRVDRRAQSMRDKIASGKQVVSHVRVSLRLRNGNKMIGVVKDGRFVERVDGLRFVDANAKEQGAGIRLWYSGGKRNYVFLPFEDVAQYEVMQRLTQKQLDEIENEIALKEGKKDARKTDPAASPAPAGETGAPVQGGAPADPFGGVQPAPGQPVTGQPVGAQPTGTEPQAGTTKSAKGAKGDAKTDGEAEKTGADDVQKTYFKLLQEYPPAGGWNKAKRDEIARRKAVIGATPSDKEKAFVENFDTWLKACKHFGVDGSAEKDEGKEGDEAQESGGEESDGKRRGRRTRR